MHRHPRAAVAPRPKPSASASRRAFTAQAIVGLPAAQVAAAAKTTETPASKPPIARVRDGLVLRVVRQAPGARNHADARRAR